MRPRQSGFTLVELLVVMGILVLVLSLIYGIFNNQIRAKFWQDRLVETQQQLRASLDLIAGDVELAELLMSTGPYLMNTTTPTCPLSQ